ncbi:MAG: hypothetical protein AAGN15_12330 [Cyanobacteria bacterium J06581_3]
MLNGGWFAEGGVTEQWASAPLSHLASAPLSHLASAPLSRQASGWHIYYAEATPTTPLSHYS